ncbi:transmembrane protein [Mycobacteroides abscessus]|nr:transmembrane protein [Mycobacteroides abscessus]
MRERSSQYLAAGLVCAALIFTLPDLAWGVAGRVTAVKYPSGWNAVAAHINADPHPVAVLPPETMRLYPWGPSSIPVLDPFPRWIRADTVSSGDLRVDGHDVRGDGTRGRQVEELLRAGAAPRELAAHGVGWVVVQANTPGQQEVPSKTLTQLDTVYRDGDIALYRVPGPWSPIAAPPGRRAAVIAGHLMWIALLAAGGVAVLRRHHTRQAGSGGTPGSQDLRT